eukprot:CAMPEP_0172310960 /NCGR_PEP_ID=MMETSP1058-20130122/13463_1 /TAXON_ID=83371 /ORGANISM="Detonula confervacea, Strain CCMP 353" /LENGTH=197 /DNA_ID=CAMNT_0013023993 /DNA_START=145 /DNA_END=738 /DNA_ORIENTATION=+
MTPTSRIRPSTSVAAFASNTEIFGQQRRQFHLTPITQDDKASGDAAVAAPAAANADEPIAPFISPKVEALFQKFLHLDMIEIHLLGELINEKLGITISDAERERMARGGGGNKAAGDAAPAEVVEEKTIFDLKLTGFDAKSKIKVIKEVRAMTSLGLKEAKELVEKFPSTVKKDIKKEEAEALKEKLESLGATVEIV